MHVASQNGSPTVLDSGVNRFKMRVLSLMEKTFLFALCLTILSLSRLLHLPFLLPSPSFLLVHHRLSLLPDRLVFHHVASLLPCPTAQTFPASILRN